MPQFFHAPSQRFLTSWMAATLCLGGCQAPIANVPVTKRAPAAASASTAASQPSDVLASPSVSVRTGSEPTAAPVVAATADVALSVDPATGAMTGKVKVDAEYLLTQGLAKLGPDGLLRILKGVGITPEELARHRAAGTLDTLLPAGGMEIAARLLGKDQAIPVGVDAAGQPILKVLSNPDGSFKLDLPPGLVENVLLTARVPDANDARLVFGLVTNPGAPGEKAIDEVSALIATYLSKVFVVQMGMEIDPGPQGTNALLGPEVLRKLTPKMRQQIAEKATEALLAWVPLDEVKLLPLTRWPGPEEKAIPAMAAVLAQVRIAAAAKMAADPEYFKKAAYVINENVWRTGDDRIVIRRPGDLGDFLIKLYLSASTYEKGPAPGELIRGVLADIGVAPNQADHFDAAASGLFDAIQNTLETNPTARAKVLAALAGALGSTTTP